MKVKLTLARPGSSMVDLTVTAEPTTTIGDIARELANADPSRSGALAGADSVTLRLHASGAKGTTGTRVLDYRTVLADSRLAGGVIVSIAPASESNQAEQTSVASLTVIDGPDRGTQFGLASGSTVIGRGLDGRVVFSDPLVSKAHVRVNITDAAEVIDLGSSNGTFVNGEQVDRASLATGDLVSIGDTVFSVAVNAQAASADISGVEYLNRSPRLDPQYPGRSFTAPEPPERPKPQRLPIIALIAPLVMGAALFAITKSPTSLLFVALSPLIMIATYIDNRVQIRRQWKTATADFLATVAAMESEIDEEHDREVEGRLREVPSLGSVAADATSRGPLLWTRRPEHDAFLLIRLGLGRMPSRISFEMPAQRKGVPEHWSRIVALSQRAAMIGPVPVAENFFASGSIGVAGPSTIARGVARALVAQLVGLHSPAELVVAGLASLSSAPAWDWLKWLPHVGSAYAPFSAGALAVGGQGTAALISELEGVIAQRSSTEDKRQSRPLPSILVVVEDDAPVERARLVALAERGPAVGVHLLWVSASLARIPAACRTFLELAPSTGDALAGYVHTALGVQPVECQSVDDATALAFARSLAPVVDAGARMDDASDLPKSVSLLHLLGHDLASDPSSVIGRWRETNSILTGPMAAKSAGKSRPNLRAVFGQGSAEPFAIDLRIDGPHALVGGTTGSGKSEFLQAWVLGLAAAHSPQRVSFLFVDYKGGSAFANCTDLPHSVGIVTDLSQHMVRRALTSLRAELRYREHLFLRKKFKDIIDFERSGDPEVPPSLLIVVDEFAALATEVPEFVDGVVDVAQRGRSLGLHLILATQRPAGVIRDNLRANTNLRIALRMADESDSDDVLGTPMAASFDSSIPGRGAAKTGPGRIRGFQSGYAGGWTSEAPEQTSVVIEELSFGLPQAWEAPRDEAVDAAKAAASEGPTDIQRIVANVRAAVVQAEIPAPRKPWLPVLADSYDFSKLPNRRTDSELVLGVVDDAAAQSQPTVSFFPDRDGNMAIIGTGGSGKSTALRTIAVASAVTMRGGPTHVYGVDFGTGGLKMLESLPHVGAIISGDDEERLGRLLRWLRDLVDQRAVRYSEARAGNISEYRKIADQPAEPRVLLLLDGMSAFRDAYETSIVSPWFSVFSQIATDGRQVGVHVIVTGDRASSIPPSLASSTQRRIVLRLAKQDDYGLLGVPGDVLSASSPPGRGILGDLETQLAVLGGDPNVALQARSLEDLGASMVKAGVQRAPGVERLSDFIELRNLPNGVGGRASIGIADEDLSPIGIETSGTFAIIGSPGSGRTTALTTIATAVKRAHPETELYHLSPRRSSLAGLGIWTETADGTEAVKELVDRLSLRMEPGKTAAGALAIFVEHVSEFHESELERQMEMLVKLVIRAEQFLVAESETSTWNQAYSVSRPIRSSRRGLVLQPEEGDADLLKASFGRISRTVFPVGRGFLVGGGRSRKLQVATTEDLDLAPSEAIPREHG